MQGAERKEDLLSNYAGYLDDLIQFQKRNLDQASRIVFSLACLGLFTLLDDMTAISHIAPLEPKAPPPQLEEAGARL